jgi:hypothetical protein
MSVRGGQLEDLTQTPVSECTRPGATVCSPKSDIEKMRDFLKNTGLRTPPNDRALIVEDMKKVLGVANEAEIYENRSFQNYIGYTRAKKILNLEFKPPGPANGTALLDNFNIDETLQRWAHIANDEFGKKFYHIPFQMIDFDKTGTELSKLDISDLIKKGYDSFGVVLNTDVSSGRGIHWFCLYGDLRADPVRLEYFNSSGYPPKPEVQVWLERQIINLKKSGINAEYVYATGGRQIQYSKTECGVWSLVYILSRLTDHPFHWIAQVGANDEDMISFRARLFRS